MLEVCHNVEIEPHLQPVTGKVLLPSHKMELDWMWLQMDSREAGLREHFDIMVLTHTLPQTDRPNMHPVTAAMKTHQKESL